MSLLPLQTIKTIRKLNDMTVDHFGFDCDLYMPKPQVIKQREGLDVYQETPELDKEKYQAPIKTKVFVEWKPDVKRLRNLGIFTEENLPILAWFKNIEGLQRDCFIKVSLNDMEGVWSTDEFTLVDRVVKHMYDAAAVEGWLLAPRRRKE